MSIRRLLLLPQPDTLSPLFSRKRGNSGGVRAERDDNIISMALGIERRRFPMWIKVVLIFTLLAAATTFLGCSKSRDTISGSPSDENLLTNSSFEILGMPSLHGWLVSDTSAVHFSQEAPPGGGCWSVAIDPGWVPTMYSISTTVAAPEGSHRYELSFWTMSWHSWGMARVILKRPDTLMVRKYLSFSDTTWSTYSLFDTLSTNKGDSVVIELWGGMEEISPAWSKTLYDLVRLQKLN